MIDWFANLTSYGWVDLSGDIIIGVIVGALIWDLERMHRRISVLEPESEPEPQPEPEPDTQPITRGRHAA